MIATALLAISLVSGTAADYAEHKQQLATSRTKLAKRLAGAEGNARAAVVGEARAQLLATIGDHLLPAWIGTTWGFYGTSREPGRGEIACGYLVSTVLRDAGFEVARVKLAQQASEHIILSMKPSRVWRFRTGKVTDVLAQVARAGDGIYLVGLDYHVGFLLRRDGTTRFCHSSYLAPGRAVCSDPATDAAMESSYHVVGPVLEEDQVVAWLEGQAFPTVTGRR